MLKKENYIKFILIAALITVILFILNSLWWRTYGGDTEWYIAAAEGRWSELIQPYSARFLHPFLVGSINRLFSLDIHYAFLLVGTVSVFLFIVLNAVIFKKTINLKPILLIPLFFSPYFLLTIREVFEPDAFYILLTAVFFLLLFFKKEIYALFGFFFLFLTRESTSLLGVILAMAAWFKRKKNLALTTVAILIISVYLGGAFNSIGQPNVHHLNSPVYLVAKLSYNFLTNVLGVKPWVNTYANCEPIFKFNLPDNKLFGNIHEIGFCGFEVIKPVQTLVILLTIFGIAPLLLFYILIKKRKEVFKELPFWMLIALIYGLANYFIGVVAGTGIQRIVGYGWPAFLLLTPIFISMFFETDKKFIVKLSLIQLFVAWLPLIVYRFNGDTLVSAVLVLFAVSLGYIYAFKSIKNQKIKNVVFSENS